MMKFNTNLAAMHGYLCADGYVIKNPNSQKHKYYYIGLRNTDETLLKDFQKKFESVFGLRPIITNDGRCKIQNKKIYEQLTKQYSYYSHEWKLPSLTNGQLNFWLRAFFDCEGWVENQPRKSRLIGLDCCNEKGLRSIQAVLSRLKIASKIHKRKNRTIWRLTICGKENLESFRGNIGFLHPRKKNRLNEAIGSYTDFIWKIPKDARLLLEFIRYKGRVRKTHNQIRFTSIKKVNVSRLKKVLNRYNLESSIKGPWKNSNGSSYYCLTINNWRKQCQDLKLSARNSKKLSKISGK